MNDELERIWKIALVVYFKVISRHSPGGTEDNHENNQIIQCAVRDSNRLSPKCKQKYYHLSQLCSTKLHVMKACRRVHV
jgi:hypothetical protein